MLSGLLYGEVDSWGYFMNICLSYRTHSSVPLCMCSFVQQIHSYWAPTLCQTQLGAESTLVFFFMELLA